MKKNPRSYGENTKKFHKNITGNKENECFGKISFLKVPSLVKVHRKFQDIHEKYFH